MNSWNVNDLELKAHSPRILASTKDARIAGTQGLLVEFDPGERHAVRAVSDTRLLLLLTPWPGVGHPDPCHSRTKSTQSSTPLNTETVWPAEVALIMRAASPDGVQSGEQTGRNLARLRATELALEPRIAPGTSGSLRLGAGRSQVQILSPRSQEVPANWPVLASCGVLGRGTSGENVRRISVSSRRTGWL
jgi:hypothetical protein